MPVFPCQSAPCKRKRGKLFTPTPTRWTESEYDSKPHDGKRLTDSEYDSKPHYGKRLTDSEYTIGVVALGRGR